MTGTIEKISEQRCFEGTQGFYRHSSTACAGQMRFAVYQPPQAAKGPVPVLYYLSGLTCTEENFTIKAGAQRVAAELGLMLVMPDTSPRDTGIAGIADDFEFGNAAGFYLDATQAPYSKFFNMYTYVTEELPRFVGILADRRADARALGKRQGIPALPRRRPRNLETVRRLRAYRAGAPF